MTVEEIEAFAKGLVSGQSIWFILSLCIGAAAAYFGAHLAEKGKNRATKEDIGEITKAVEIAKSEFSKQLEDLKAHHQLRMVAAERRIQAHQTAFQIGSQIYQRIHNFPDNEWEATVQNAVHFYEAHALFLGTQTRKAFIKTVNSAKTFRALKQASGQTFIYGKEDCTPEQKELRKQFDQMLQLFDYVATEVELPAINVKEQIPFAINVG